MDSRGKRQTEKNHRSVQAMRHAIDGIIQVLREERNMWYRLLAACLATIMSALLQISAMEWLWILLAIFVVFISGFLSAVTEAVADLIVDHHYELNVKKARDIAAGGILISAIFSVLMGLIIFISRMLAVIR